LAQEKGFKIFFLGAKPEVIQRLEIVLRKDYPKLEIAGFHHGYFDQADSRAVLELLTTSKPDILFVAMGLPKQEFWIKENFDEIQVPVSMGIGGSFDVLSGMKKDTPSWARGHGWEWLYRISQDPKAYLKRYLVINSWIIWNVIKEYIRKKVGEII
jgi:N-acetylglucosaminyldiphosphoundecaprenol N-acetyl-beta-D-mannosaminyltransferase